VTWAFSERSANDTPAVPSDAMVIDAVCASIDGFTNGDADVIRQAYAPDAVLYDLVSGTT
jgi:hypothetical protein